MNTCLVLGAGASRANALHFHPKRMRDTWPPLDGTFFQTMAARKIALPLALRKYLARFLGHEPVVDELVGQRMEEMFKDVFYDFLETPNDTVAYDAYIALVQLYLEVLRGTTNWLGASGRTGAPVGRLLAAAAKTATNLTVITFNHDLVIENEIRKRASLVTRWCLDEGYGTLGAKFRLLQPRGTLPLFHTHGDGRCDHTAPITILKLHGSLNWMVRLTSRNPTPNYLSGKSGERQPYLVTAREITGGFTINRAGTGRTSWDTWPIVVPPVYAKQALRSAIQPAWADARAALGDADRVVFFGYSLPAIDVEAEKLFERALAANTKAAGVDVINPAAEAAARYAGLAPAVPVRWYPDTASFFTSDRFKA
jgi:hypothetical protein